MSTVRKLKLTDKQELFCQEYMIDLNATQASKRAGYSEKTAQKIGSENLSKPLVQEKIAQLMGERIESTKIDAEWVLKRAVEFHDKCSQASKVTTRDGTPVLDDDGKPIYSFEHTGVGKALEIIGKHVGVQAFIDKQQVDVKVSTADSWATEDE